MRLLKEKVHVTGREVEQANRSVYNQKSLEAYRRNKSIFNRQQEKRLKRILGMLHDQTEGEYFLDVGCGTGNLLGIAQEIFPFCIGVDQADAMLAGLNDGMRRTKSGAGCVPVPFLVSANARNLPFACESFDVIGMYALLHHLYNPVDVFKEAFRLLRPGGVLYTDHDPNRHFGRFYHPWFRWRYRDEPAFGSSEEDLAEFHHVYTDGLDPKELAGELKNIGFPEVDVKYRHSTNRNMTGVKRMFRTLLKACSIITPFSSIYTHFMIFARR